MEYRKVKLGDLFDITSGGTPSRKKNEYYEDGDIAWIKTGDLKKKYLDKASEYITELGLNKSSAKLFPKETVLLAMYGATIGDCSILSIEAASNQACAAFRPNENVIPEYLYYYLLVNKKYLVDRGVGGAQPNISISILKEISFPLTSIEEQKKIVAILDKAQGLIEKRKEAITKLDELVQSVFLAMFGDMKCNPSEWNTVKLKDVLKVDTKLMKNLDDMADFPLVGIDNIKKNTGEIVNCLTAKEANVSGNKYFFNENHILYSKIRPYLNKVAAPTFSGVCSTDAYPLLIDEDRMNKAFCLTMLRSEYFVAYAIKNSKGANIPRIDKKQLLDFTTILPNIEIQKQYAEKYLAIEEEQKLMKKSLLILEDYLQSLLQRAFNGELKFNTAVNVC